MSPRLRNILLIAAGVILIAIAGWFLFFRSRPAPPVEPPPVVVPSLPPSGGLTTSATVPGGEALTPESPLTPSTPTPVEPDGQLVVRQQAEIFAERYGSYSNQGDYQNLKDLLPLMTASFRAENEAIIEAGSGQTPPETYEGVTSEKISSTVEAFDEARGEATVVVLLQQTKSKGTTTVSYARLSVELEKTGDEWLIGAAAWTP